MEIIPKDGFFDYENKYQDGGAREICPPVSLDADTQKAMQQAGEQAFEALRMDVYARADFIVDETDGRFYCLEVNGLPGMTPRKPPSQGCSRRRPGLRQSLRTDHRRIDPGPLLADPDLMLSYQKLCI